MPEPHIGAKRNGSTFGSIVFMLLGLIAWALHLTVIYSAQSTICTFATPGEHPRAGLNVIEIIILIATLVAAAAALSPLVAPAMLSKLLRTRTGDDDERSFQRSVAALIAVLSVAGIIWGGATAFFLSPCAALR